MEKRLELRRRLRRKKHRQKGGPSLADRILNQRQDMLQVLALGAVAESVEHGTRVWGIGSLVPDGIKPMTFIIDKCRFLAWRLALIG